MTSTSGPSTFPASLPEAELTRYFTQLRPVGGILQNAEEDTRARVIQTVRAAFEPYVARLGSEVHGGVLVDRRASSLR